MVQLSESFLKIQNFSWGSPKNLEIWDPPKLPITFLLLDRNSQKNFHFDQPNFQFPSTKSQLNLKISKWTLLTLTIFWSSGTVTYHTFVLVQQKWEENWREKRKKFAVRQKILRVLFLSFVLTVSLKTTTFFTPLDARKCDGKSWAIK
jgi:hypothetical protein